MRFMSMLAGLTLIALGSVSATAQASQSPDARWQHVQADTLCEPGTMGQMFPFSMNDGMQKEVADIATMTYVLNILPFGGLWGPLALLPEGHPEITSDQVISYLVPVIGGGVLFCLVIGLPIAFYIAPTASLNAWDRAYKCGAKKSVAFQPSPAMPQAQSAGFAF